MSSSGCKIVAISAAHKLSSYDCGEPELNIWLQKHALNASKSGSAQTFLAIGAKDEIMGYYAIAAQSVVAEAAPVRLKKGMPRHPIPVILLTRLAVDQNFKGCGVGAGLLKNALLRCLNASKEVGVRAVIVDAKNDAARLFYQHFDFAVFPDDTKRLFLLIKDLRQMLSDG